MPNYEVHIKAYATVLVMNAKDEEQALEFANDISHGDLEIDELKIESEVKPDQLESSRRHANWVCEDA